MKRKQPGAKRGKTRHISAVAGDKGLNRRTFVKLIPALGVATIATPQSADYLCTRANAFADPDGFTLAVAYSSARDEGNVTRRGTAVRH